MVQINVSQLLKAAIGATQNYNVNNMIDITGDGKDNMVQGKVRLMRTNRGILVQGTLNTEVEVTCSRCLSLCSCPLSVNVEEEYFPTRDMFNGTSLPLPDQPGCFTIDEHQVIDLTEAIRQYALLATPMKPICREDCTGLCPNCGHNLNHGQCGCLTQKADPRWAKLDKLASASDKQ